MCSARKGGAILNDLGRETGGRQRWCGVKEGRMTEWTSFRFVFKVLFSNDKGRGDRRGVDKNKETKKILKN